MNINNILNLLFLFLMFLVYLFCKKNSEQKISSFISTTKEVIEFCEAMIPCIREEISTTFRDLPQQREYLLSKTSLQNCILEQSFKLEELLHMSNEQVFFFYHSINKISNGNKNIDIHSTLKNLYPFIHNDQKKILDAFIQCKNNMIQNKKCSDKKNTIKINLDCLKIYANKNNKDL